MDKVIIHHEASSGAGLAGLEGELQREWQRRRRGSAGRPNGHQVAREAQLPSPARRVPDGAQFLGRRVLKGSLAHVEGQIRAQATELGIEGYRSVRQPMGLRYLGYRVLQELKAYSHEAGRGGEAESALNRNVRTISRFDEIMETALADMGEQSAAYAAEDASVFTDGMSVITYENDDGSSFVVVGAKLVNSVKPWQSAFGLQAERDYFLRNYAPGFDPQRKPSSGVFVPLGWMPGMEWQDDYMAALREGQMTNLQHVAVRLGPVGLSSELGWGEA